jgi:hypothetical protein
MKNKYSWSSKIRVVQPAFRWAATLLFIVSIQTAETFSVRGSEPLDVWKINSSPTTSNLRSIVFAEGQFVAVGENGLITTSPNGTAWTLRKSGTTDSLLGIAFGKDRFITVGSPPNGNNIGTILVSKDGANWTQLETGITNALISIAYGNNRFVVGSYLNGTAKIYTSEDGEYWKSSWERKEGLTDPGWISGIAFGNGRFVAVYPGSQGVNSANVLTSLDGDIWTMQELPTGVTKVTFGNGLFVGVGTYNEMRNKYYISHAIAYTSPDGVNWTNSVDAEGPYGTSFFDVVYGGGQFVAVGSSATFSSADGTNWVSRTGYDVYRWGVSFGNGQFVAVGGGGLIEISGSIGKLGASLSNGGQFIVSLSGMSGQKYTIQSSTRLGDWIPFTNVSINNGFGHFIDSSMTNHSTRYYKALLVNK